MSRNVYDFGPLLIGKDPESRNLLYKMNEEGVLQKSVGLPKKQQMLLDKQIQERELSGYVHLELPKIPLAEPTEDGKAPDDKELDEEVKAKL